MTTEAIVLEGLVQRRTEVKGYEFPFGTQYEFYALIFDDNKNGHKVNIPEIFGGRVVAGHRVRIHTIPIMNQGWIRLRPTDEVTDLGPSDFDPTQDFVLGVGYVPLPVNGNVKVHNPKGGKGIKFINVALNMLPKENTMYSIWYIRGLKVGSAVRVTEFKKSNPITKMMTHESRMSVVRFRDDGIRVHDLFIPNDILPFRSIEHLNVYRNRMVGTIKIKMSYGLSGRWNVKMNADQTKWVPQVPEEIVFTDPATVNQINRYIEEITENEGKT